MNVNKARSISEIIDAFKRDELINWICDGFASGPDDTAKANLAICVEAHNADHINLLSLTTKSAFKDVIAGRFFDGQQFYCGAIPQLNAEVPEMMDTVRTLVAMGGQDLAANFPNSAFREWCKASLSRSESVISSAKKGDALAIEHLTFALEAGDFLEDAIHFAKSYTDARLLSGVTALGRIDVIGSKNALRIFRVFIRLLTNNPCDTLCSNILQSTINIAERNKLLRHNKCVQIIKLVCDHAGPQTHYIAAQIVGDHHQNLLAVSIGEIFSILEKIEFDHNVTIEFLDHSLCRMLEGPCTKRAIDLVETLLTRHEASLESSQFQGFWRKLFSGSQATRNEVTVSWLMNGNPKLCFGLASMFSDHESGGKPLELSDQLRELTPGQQMFICRKAIGYFFTQPVSAASVLVSAIRIADEPMAQEIGNLLFANLLINYGGYVVDYLKSIKVESSASAYVDQALLKQKEYVDTLQTVGNIEELQPSTHERQLEYLRFCDEIRQSHKEAEQQSPFFDVFMHSTLLHGNRSMTAIGGEYGEQSLMNIELGEFSASVEVARLDIIDPIGLDYRLRVFRAERLSQ